MFTRPTAFAAAFVRASADALLAGKVNNNNWVPRVVAHNATERPGFGMVTEYDRRPGQRKHAKVDHAFAGAASIPQTHQRVLNISSGEDAFASDNAFISQHANMQADYNIGG